MPLSKSLWFLSRKNVGFKEENVATSRDDEILVETLYTGISHGTERLIYRGEVARGLELDSSLTRFEGSFPFPVKYGYSNVGRVVEAGKDVNQLKKGDIIFAFIPHETAYTISEAEAIPLPSAIKPLYGVFIPSLETAVNVVLDADVRVGESVVVFGQGTVGLFITHVLRTAGVDTIVTVDTLEKRRQLSLQFGADFALDPATADIPTAIAERTGDSGADVVIEASGSPSALDTAIQSAAFQSQIVVVSWYGTKPVRLNLGEAFHRKRLQIKSSQVSFINPALMPRWSKQRRMKLVFKFLKTLDLDAVLEETRLYPFEAAEAAYRLIDEHPEEALQVILSYGQV